MSGFEIKEKYDLGDLPKIVALLRDPETGCPWDKVQTHESIRQNFLEETYEVADAIDRKDEALLKEELGDVLLQVALHAEIERQQGGFSIDDVADGICKKLVARHPHIFADTIAGDADAVLDVWQDIKKKEKNQKTGSDAINDVPAALPALMRSQKVQNRAAHVGFDYTDLPMAVQDLDNEVAELKQAIAGSGDIEDELGDVFFAGVNVARFLKLDAELATTKSCDKFARRFRAVEQLARERGIDMETSSMDALNELWAEAKKLDK